MSKSLHSLYVSTLMSGGDLDEAHHNLNLSAEILKQDYSEQYIFAKLLKRMLDLPEDSKDHQAASAFLQIINTKE